jgi:3,4-dihydroxy 2-butanone 4-phosphate synthase/GTP cyclohydrolase II
MKATPETSMLWRVATARMPTKRGMFHAIGFKREVASGVPGVETALAIVMGDLSKDAPLLRIHSQCFTGETLGSLRCRTPASTPLRPIVPSDSRRTTGISVCRPRSLRDLRVRRVRLLTNNPHKVHALTDAGIEVVARIPCEAALTSHSLVYLRTKKERMGHALSLRPSRAASDKFAWRGSDHSRTVGAAREI